MNDALRSALKQAAALGAAGEPGGAAPGSRRPRPEPRRVPGTDPPGRAGGAVRPAAPAAGQGGPVPRAEAAGRLRLGVQPVDQEEADASTWRPAGSSARRATCSGWGRRAWARASWCRRSATRRSRPGIAVLYRSIFDVVRDFLHDEALSAARTRCWRGTSSRTC